MKKDCRKTLDFLRHIFGVEYENGLQYIKALCQKNSDIKLPILSITSKENETGKTTFAKWLKIIFKEEMIFASNAMVASINNSSFITKRIICIDETFLDEKHVLKKVLEIYQHKIMLVNDQKEICEFSFSGNFILLSNHINDDRLYDYENLWTIFIPRRTDITNNNLLKEMMEETTSFLLYLMNMSSQSLNFSSEEFKRNWRDSIAPADFE